MGKKEDQERRRILINSKLSKKGITGSDRRAIIANIDLETSGSFDPKQRQNVGKGKSFKEGKDVPESEWFDTKKSKGKGRGTGLIQWDDRRKSSKRRDGSVRTGLKEFAEKKGKKWDDLDTQIDFLHKEVTTPGYEKHNFKKVKKEIGTVNKTKAFSKYVERPGKPHLKKRIKYAEKIERRELDAQGLMFGAVKEEPTPLADRLKEQISGNIDSNNSDGKSLVGIEPMRQDQDGTILGRLRNRVKPVETDEETAKKNRAQENSQMAQSGQARQKLLGEQLVNSQPEAVKEVVKSQVQDNVTASEINKDIDNKVLGKQRQEGPASQFTEALTFFLPQILGGLAGAAFEGTEGALGGIQAGGQARDSFLKNQRASKELELKSGSKETEQRRLNIAEANLGLRGKKLDMDKGAETRRGKQLDLNMSKFGLQEQQAGQLSGKQVDQLKDMNNVELSIDRIEELRKQTNTGPLAGRVQSMAQWADAAPESFNKMKAQTASTLSNYVKSISGAQVAEAEAVRLQAVIPSVNDSPGVFKDKLEEFKKIVQMNKKAFAQAIATGQPLKAGAIQGLLEAEGKFNKQDSSAIKSGFDAEKMKRYEAFKASRNK